MFSEIEIEPFPAMGERLPSAIRTFLLLGQWTQVWNQLEVLVKWLDGVDEQDVTEKTLTICVNKPTGVVASGLDFNSWRSCSIYSY